MSPPPVLIAALSGRALAAAARRAGFLPLVVDCFGDADTAALAGTLRVAAGPGVSFAPSALLANLDELRGGTPQPPVGLVLGSGFEDRPELAAACAAILPVLGNGAAAIRRTKDPASFYPLLDRLGIAHPEVRLDQPARPGGWLAKRIGGSGGSHIRWDGTRRRRAGAGNPDPRTYFQRFVHGTPVSLLAVATRKGTAIIGASRQWCAPARDVPFRYGGAVGPVPVPGPVARAMAAAVRAAIRELELVGLVTADFVLGAGSPLLLEINPRPGATLDLFDDAAGTLFRSHVEACLDRHPNQMHASPTDDLPLKGGGRPPPAKAEGGRVGVCDGAAGSATALCAPEPDAAAATSGIAAGPPPGAAGAAPTSPFQGEVILEGARAAGVLYADAGSVWIPDAAWPAWTADRPRANARIAAGAPVCTVFAEGGDPDEAERSCRARMGALQEVLYARAPARNRLHDAPPLP